MEYCPLEYRILAIKNATITFDGKQISMSGYKNLKTRFKKISQIDHALTFLSWDQMVMMPERGVNARSASMAELASIRHELLTESRMSDWFCAAIDTVVDANQRLSLREMRKQWQQATIGRMDLLAIFLLMLLVLSMRRS